MQLLESWPETDQIMASFLGSSWWLHRWLGAHQLSTKNHGAHVLFQELVDHPAGEWHSVFAVPGFGCDGLSDVLGQVFVQLGYPVYCSGVGEYFLRDHLGWILGDAPVVVVGSVIPGAGRRWPRYGFAVSMLNSWEHLLLGAFCRSGAEVVGLEEVGVVSSGGNI